MIEVFDNSSLGITCFNCVHSSTRGLHNGRHAIRGGGIRRHNLSEPELHVIKDGLNLARSSFIALVISNQ